MHLNLLLLLSCIALLLIIAAQDLWYAPLRNETISAGLTGPYHVLLDAAYVPLAYALCTSFGGHPAMMLFGVISGLALIAVAVTNTAWRLVDRFTDGKHALWHSRLTLVVFVAAIALQVSGDHQGFWILTALNILVPGACYLYFHLKPTIIGGVAVAASPAAEKLYVFFLCLWLVIYSL